MAAELSITVPQDLAQWGERKLDNAIAKGHSAAGAHMHNYEQVATITGVLLRERKARCAHGEWLPWLAEHFAGSEWTARRYLNLADNLAPNSAPAPDLDPAAAPQPEPAALPAGPADEDRITHAQAAGIQRAASTAPEVVDAEPWGDRLVGPVHYMPDLLPGAPEGAAVREGVVVWCHQSRLIAEMLAAGEQLNPLGNRDVIRSDLDNAELLITELRAQIQ